MKRKYLLILAKLFAVEVAALSSSGEGKIEKEDLMKDDEVEEVSRWMRIGQSLLPKQMNNLGIYRRKRVKISIKEQSV